MQDFKHLRVWQAANQLTADVYKTTRAFPPEERFGLTAQLRRAAVSIQANIAEGFGRGTKADTARFLQMATGSAAEVANHLHVARGLEYMPAEQFAQLDEDADHVRRMLIRLLLRIKPQIPSSQARR